MADPSSQSEGRTGAPAAERHGSPAVNFAPVPRRNAVDEVRAQLAGAIQSGRFRVDDRLPPESELARMFEVSRPVVREALRSLGAMGLTRPIPGRGTFVVSTEANVPWPLGHFSTAELSEVMRSLEVSAAGVAARRCETVGTLRLRRILEEHQSDRAVDLTGLENSFHRAICEASGNTLVVHLRNEIFNLLHQGNVLHPISDARSSRIHREHLTVVQAIERGDRLAAEQAMISHLEAARREL